MPEELTREQKVKNYVDVEMEKYQKRKDAIHNRALELTPVIHQNCAIIHRYELNSNTFLDKPDGSKGHALRMSWSGKILFISDIESDDPIIEEKKKLLKENGDLTVLFNPESAYSLNIQDYPEIWVMHIDGFLTFDKAYNPDKIAEERIDSRSKVLSL